MKNFIKIQANIFIYITLLLFIFTTSGIVIYNNFFTINYIILSGINNIELLSKINSKGDLSLKLVKAYNSNGDGFVDLLSCPTNITMSGTTFSGTNITSNIYNNAGFFYCLGNYNSDEFKIFFNSDFSDFSKIFYKDSFVNLNIVINEYFGDINLNDEDSTFVSFLSNTSRDNIDDNNNSDNYKVTSTGSIYFPNNYEDDDVIPRKTIFGNLIANGQYESIFWNNYKTNAIIDLNDNNNDILNYKIGDIDNGYFYLDLYNISDFEFDIKIIELDKLKYTNEGILFPINIMEGINIKNYSGYIQSNGINISLSKQKTGNEYIFDFKNNDYVIFIKNKSNNNISYELRGEFYDGKGIYINPINDSKNETIEVLSNLVIIDNNNLIGENILITGKK